MEVYNDLNGDLVRFWMMARDHPEALQARIDTLPYSRQLYRTYRESLNTGEALDDLERAARWFYVLRSTFGGGPDLKKGWGYQVGRAAGHSKAHALRTATALLPLVAARFRSVQIEQQDFAHLITTYQTPRALFYCDPPYIDCDYYAVDDVPPFTFQDHERLATLLNATPALVALSYYDHPLLERLYPSSRWRRMAWTQTKAVEKTRASRKLGQEVLLMNYPETVGGLWQALPTEEGEDTLLTTLEESEHYR